MLPIATEQHWIDTANAQVFAQSWTPHEAQGTAIVLLHDSLGCVALWRDFPERLAQATGRTVIAYDRVGFGRSSACSSKLPLTFVEDEALGSFDAVCRHFDLNRFVVLGHSVGAGMAIGCAAAYPQHCEGVITESAQTFVEALTLEGIREADRQFAEPGQIERLHKYHGDKADWVLKAWVDTWLSEAFSDWTLDAQLSRIRSPMLALHGDRDEYGSLAHLERMATKVSARKSLQTLNDCGHVPHREYPETVLAKVVAFLDEGRQLN